MLAIIADLYTPLLALIFLRCLLRANSVERRAPLYSVLANLAVAWGGMFLDGLFGVFPAWSLDYSTHTAVALALVICLSFQQPHRRAYWAGSLAAYAALMMVLDYHSLADIAVTVLLAGGIMLPLTRRLYRKRRGAAPQG